MEAAISDTFVKPSEWMERHYYVPEPRDLVTGEILQPGPIILADHQKQIVDEALSVDEEGNLKYVTVIYSAPKKSGKSAIASGVTLYKAYTTPYSNLYCLANDGKSATDRIYHPIYRNFELHRKYGGIFSGFRPKLTEATLPNGTKIEAVPCDAAGEAGAEPLMSTWSELWGFDTEKKMRLWTEMTVPPTKYGRALRWVESYAGFVGQSTLLENLYQVAVREGIPHPDFTHLKGRDGEPVVWINPEAKIFAYWDTLGRMIWQSEEFYNIERKHHTESEFERVHRNQWVSPIGAFIKAAWWDGCRDSALPVFTSSTTPVVVAIDAATENDCAAMVAVTRHPDNPEIWVAVRDCKIFTPSQHSSIILSETIGKTLIEWSRKWNIVCVAYDSYQMKKMVQDYRKGHIEVSEEEVAGFTAEEQQVYIEEKRRSTRLWYYEFSQHGERAKADKQLYDMILTKHLRWQPNVEGIDIPSGVTLESLDKHVKQAGAKTVNNQYRITKLSDQLKIDAAVALSMAVDRCLALNISNDEKIPRNAKKAFNSGEISYEDYIKAIAHKEK